MVVHSSSTPFICGEFLVTAQPAWVQTHNKEQNQNKWNSRVAAQIDAMDTSGDQQLGVQENIFKVRLDHTVRDRPQERTKLLDI